MSSRYITAHFLIAMLLAFAAAYLYFFVVLDRYGVKGVNTQETIQKTALGIWQRCQGETADCYEDGVGDRLVDKYSVSEILSALYDYDQYFSCHAFTHYVGRALWAKYKSVADAYSEIDFTCHGGAYHGVIEAYFQRRQGGWENIDGEEINKICSDSTKKTEQNPSQIFNECLHAMGHAFMFLTDADLPKSLEYCERIEEKGNRETCYGGAFMENSTSSTNPDHPSKWIREDDKFYPCTILPDRQLNHCYLYQANYWIKDTNYDWPTVFANCAELSGTYRDYCHLGMGSNLAGFSTAKSIVDAAQVCGLPDAPVGRICAEGAAAALLARYGGETEKVKEFCDAVSDELIEFCFVKMGAVARGWGHSDEEVTGICRTAGEFEQACLGNSDLRPQY